VLQCFGGRCFGFYRDTEAPRHGNTGQEGL
jgi:hypothetical protein